MLAMGALFHDTLNDRYAKESHVESSCSWGLWNVGALCAVTYAALILLHTSAELMSIIRKTYIAGQSGASTHGIQRVYQTMYPCEEPILEPVDHRMQIQYTIIYIPYILKLGRGEIEA